LAKGEKTKRETGAPGKRGTTKNGNPTSGIVGRARQKKSPRGLPKKRGGDHVLGMAGKKGRPIQGQGRAALRQKKTKGTQEQGESLRDPFRNVHPRSTTNKCDEKLRGFFEKRPGKNIHRKMHPPSPVGRSKDP